MSIIKKVIIIITGIIIASSSMAYATSILASSVEYTPNDTNWNVNVVSDALDELYMINSSIKQPVGDIISYMGNNIPHYYLACDGTIYNIVDYPYLAEHFRLNFGSINYFGGDGTTTFAVPDLRGEFLRGTGANSHNQQGSGVDVGVHQDGTLHIGTYVADYGKGMYTLMFNQDNRASNADYGIYGSPELNSLAGTFHTNNDWRNILVSYTSRPTNTSVLYAIRYK